MKLVERAGVIIRLSQFGGAPISGVTFRVPGKPPLVLLDALHPGDRQRYTLAHELGHLVMHRSPTARMESEATEFASAFLMPTTLLLGLGRAWAQVFRFLVLVIAAIFKPRALLIAENLCPRQQLLVLAPRLPRDLSTRNPPDRLFAPYSYLGSGYESEFYVRQT